MNKVALLVRPEPSNAAETDARLIPEFAALIEKRLDGHGKVYHGAR
jgi:hypothetical protein